MLARNHANLFGSGGGFGGAGGGGIQAAQNRQHASASITIPTNAVRAIQNRRHSSDDVNESKSFLDTNNLSMLNDILSPATPPSPSFSKHMPPTPQTFANNNNGTAAVRSQSTNQPSNPWHSDQSLALAFVSSPPNTTSQEVLPLSLVSFNHTQTQLDQRAQELINILKPSAEAVVHRKSVVRYISRHIKQTLGAAAFPIGAYALNTCVVARGEGSEGRGVRGGGRGERGERK
jgi:hypothetical protein